MEVRAENISYAYRRRQVLTDLGWHVPPGVTGLLGPNGAGKTTLLSLVVTLHRLQSGSIRVGEHDLTTGPGRKAARRVIGYLPQRFSLVPGMSVLDTVAYVAWLNGLAGTDCFPAAHAALSRVGMADDARRRVRQLSGGMRQRVGIAAAIAHDPRVLVLDEPTVGLDPSQRIQIRDMIAGIGRGRTVILSTHLVEDIAYLCDGVSVLAGGQVRFSGTLDELVTLAGRAPGGRERGSALELAYDHLLTHRWAD